MVVDLAQPCHQAFVTGAGDHDVGELAHMLIGAGEECAAGQDPAELDAVGVGELVRVSRHPADHLAHARRNRPRPRHGQ